jgi:hypothetical protein
MEINNFRALRIRNIKVPINGIAFMHLCYAVSEKKRIYIEIQKLREIGSEDKTLRLFPSSAAMLMKSALFWDITQRRVVIVYRRFGTTYRSHLHGSRVGKQLPNDAT